MQNKRLYSLYILEDEDDVEEEVQEASEINFDIFNPKYPSMPWRVLQVSDTKSDWKSWQVSTPYHDWLRQYT